MIQSLEAIVQLAITLLGTYIAAIWLCLILWTVRDIRKRTDDIVVVSLCTLLVVLFNLPGWLLYLILRPPELLVDLQTRRLQMEILARELNASPVCAHCDHPVEPDFRVCPNCGTSQKTDCSECGRLIQSSWRVCPFCATPKVTYESPPLISNDGALAPELIASSRSSGSLTTGKVPTIQGAYTIAATTPTPIIRTTGDS